MGSRECLGFIRVFWHVNVYFLKAFIKFISEVLIDHGFLGMGGWIFMVDCPAVFFQIPFLCLAVKMFPLKLSAPPMVMPGLKLMENSILQVRLEHLCWWRWKRLQVRCLVHVWESTKNWVIYLRSLAFIPQCPLDESGGFYTENLGMAKLFILFSADWIHLPNFLMVAFLVLFSSRGVIVWKPKDDT